MRRTGKAFVGVGLRPAGDAQRDLARLCRLALAGAPAGAPLHGAAEPGIAVRGIAETIGRHLGLPAVSIPAGQAGDHFTGFPFVTMDITMPSDQTRQLLGWEPVHPRLIADVDDGHYFFYLRCRR